ncbi:hypothetical protein Peur_042192 [Populus x canadensis]
MMCSWHQLIRCRIGKYPRYGKFAKKKHHQRNSCACIKLAAPGISMWTRFHMAFLFPKSTQISKSVTSLILPTITGGCSCHFHQGHWVEDPLIRPCYMPF